MRIFFYSTLKGLTRKVNFCILSFISHAKKTPQIPISTLLVISNVENNSYFIELKIGMKCELFKKKFPNQNVMTREKHFTQLKSLLQLLHFCEN